MTPSLPRQHANIAKGLCRYGASHVRPPKGQHVCAQCQEDRAADDSVRRVKASKVYGACARQAPNGKLHPTPLPGKAHCEPCLAQHSAYKPSKNVRRCKKCGDLGHFPKTCDRRRGACGIGIEGRTRARLPRKWLAVLPGVPRRGGIMLKAKEAMLLALWPVAWLYGRALYLWMLVLLVARSCRWRLRCARHALAVRSELPRARAWHRVSGATRWLMLAAPPRWPRAVLARWSIRARRRGNELAFRQGQRLLWQRQIGRRASVVVRSA